MPAKPVEYTPELGDRICAEMADGASLASICRREGMPTKASIFRWLRTHKEFATNYGIAMGERADAVFEEIFEIADDASADLVDALDDKGKPTGHKEFCRASIERARLKIDARKWALARMSPKKYGDKMTAELTGKDGQPLVTPVINVNFGSDKPGPASGPGQSG